MGKLQQARAGVHSVPGQRVSVANVGFQPLPKSNVIRRSSKVTQSESPKTMKTLFTGTFK